MWHTKKLNEVCDIQSGLWKGKKEPYTTALVLRNTNFTASGFFDYSNVVELEVEAKQLANREVIKNDIILEKSGGGDKTPVGRVCIHDKESKIPFSLSNFTARIRVLDSKELNAEFLHKFLYFLYISGKTEPMQRHSTGIRNLQLTQYKDIDVPLPPLAEQERIVAKLDAAFAEIDGAVEDSKKQETEVLKFGYRAITNKLKNLANIYSSKPLNDVVIIQPKKKLALEKIIESDDVSFMGMKELGIEQKYTEAINTKPLNEVFKSYQYFEENDVVFAKITPCYENGKLGIMKNLKNGIGFGSSEFVVLRPNSEVHSEYIYYCLLDETFRKNGTKNMSGAVGHKRVTKDYYFNYQITVPPLSMQIECIKEFDEIWKQAEIISKLKHKKINELISLKSAILKQELQSSEAA